MASDAKKAKNTALIVRKPRTGTQCLSCSWWTWPGHCSENFEQGHLRSLPELSKSQLKDGISSCYRKDSLKTYSGPVTTVPLVPFWELWMLPLMTEVQLYRMRKRTVSQNSIHVMTYTGMILRTPAFVCLLVFVFWLNTLVEGIKINDNTFDLRAGSHILVLFFFIFFKNQGTWLLP